MLQPVHVELVEARSLNSWLDKGTTFLLIEHDDVTDTLYRLSGSWKNDPEPLILLVKIQRCPVSLRVSFLSHAIVVFGLSMLKSSNDCLENLIEFNRLCTRDSIQLKKTIKDSIQLLDIDVLQNFALVLMNSRKFLRKHAFSVDLLICK